MKNTVVALICSQAINHLLTAHVKPVSECYVIERLMGQLWSSMSIAHLRTT